MSKKEAQQREIDELKQQLEQKTNEHARLSTTINDLKSVNDQLQVKKKKKKEQAVANAFHSYAISFLDCSNRTSTQRTCRYKRKGKGP